MRSTCTVPVRAENEEASRYSTSTVAGSLVSRRSRSPRGVTRGKCMESCRPLPCSCKSGKDKRSGKVRRCGDGSEGWAEAKKETGYKG
jgi:hypothetical protein